eukprot:gnl/Chilomastix_cuspidata/3105.p1 GENE.gnl/Chilomastix_cuspidata/3105~~gnl/Chilomastix_cuspidata/3105.p1  ORF type:complete len:316 (+),score=32.34 gnl/Chilomastix_cuspidata/3105:35-982(+)
MSSISFGDFLLPQPEPEQPPPHTAAIESHQAPPPNSDATFPDLSAFPGSYNKFASMAAANAATQLAGREISRAKSFFAKFFPLQTLQYYFAVSNSYIPRKLAIILCPYRRRSWARAAIQPTDAPHPPPPANAPFLPPHHDVNSPDLYIPLMAMLSLIMGVAFAVGVQGAFTAGLLRRTVMTAAVQLAARLAVYSGALRLCGLRGPPLVEMTAYLGYLGVPTALTILLRLVSGRSLWPVTAALAVSYAVFATKSLRQEISSRAQRDLREELIQPAQYEKLVRREHVFLFLFAAAEAAVAALTPPRPTGFQRTARLE